MHLQNNVNLFIISVKYSLNLLFVFPMKNGSRGRDRMVVIFTNTDAISTCHR